jgi:hypothetical protein
MTTAATTEIGRVDLTAPRGVVHEAGHVVNDRLDGLDHGIHHRVHHGIDHGVVHFVDRRVERADRVGREPSTSADGLVDAADDVQIGTGRVSG